MYYQHSTGKLQRTASPQKKKVSQHSLSQQVNMMSSERKLGNKLFGQEPQKFQVQRIAKGSGRELRNFRLYLLELYRVSSLYIDSKKGDCLTAQKWQRACVCAQADGCSLRLPRAVVIFSPQSTHEHGRKPERSQMFTNLMAHCCWKSSNCKTKPLNT